MATKQITPAKTKTKIMSLGHLSGGSYGCLGNPSNTYEYFAVEGDGDNFPNFAHTSRKLVKAHAVVVAERRANARAERRVREAAEAEAYRPVAAKLVPGIHCVRSHVGLPFDRHVTTAGTSYRLNDDGTIDLRIPQRPGKTYRVEWHGSTQSVTEI